MSRCVVTSNLYVSGTKDGFMIHFGFAHAAIELTLMIQDGTKEEHVYMQFQSLLASWN